MALALAQDPVTKIKLAPVDDKSPSAKKWLEDSSKIVVARLKAIGYDGATAEVDAAAKILAVTIPDDIQGAARQTVYAVATRQGVLELRVQKQLGILEREQFKAPKAPKGCKWYPMNQNMPLPPRAGNEGTVLAVEKAEPIARKDFGAVEAGGEGELVWTPTEAAAKKIVKLAGEHDKDNLYFCVDGDVVGWVALSAGAKEADLKKMTTANFDPKATPLALAILNGGALPAPLRAKD